MAGRSDGPGGISRRGFLQLSGSGAFALSGGLVLGGCGKQFSSSSTPPPALGAPKHGGTLRVGLSGGGPSDTLDVQNPVTLPDLARSFALADPLVRYNPLTAQTELALAEEITPSSDYTKWTVRIKRGVHLHNGREFTGDDVVASFQRIYDKKAPLSGAATFLVLDAKNVRTIDRYTVELPMLSPFNNLLDTIGNPYFLMVPRGFDPAKPVATGPFTYRDFTPGNRSTFRRNNNYWRAGAPYLDELVITDYGDESSQINALSSGQLDAVGQLSAQSYAAVRSSGSTVVVSETGSWNPVYLRSDVAPFNDARVREAFRYIADRKQINDIVIGGFGHIGNDVPSPYDRDYDLGLPQRHQDLDRAKALLKAAGREKLHVQWPVSELATGITSMAQVFVQQASQAGVSIDIRTQTPTDYFATSYLKSSMGVSFWYYLPYLATAAMATVGAAPFNETHWKSASYDHLYSQAVATKKPAVKAELARQLQKMDYDQGGYIIPFFSANIDAVGRKIGGLAESRTGFPLSGFDFTRFWIA